jgi:GTP-binding protein
LQNNVAISVSTSESSEAFNVHGRGELQLAILIEEMRREGFEMCVSAPQVLFRTDPETKQKLEPIEEVTIDVDADYSGSVIDKLSTRGGEIVDFKEMQDKVRLQFKIPSRCLMGYRSEVRASQQLSSQIQNGFTDLMICLSDQDRHARQRYPELHLPWILAVPGLGVAAF